MSHLCIVTVSTEGVEIWFNVNAASNGTIKNVSATNQAKAIKIMYVFTATVFMIWKRKWFKKWKDRKLRDMSLNFNLLNFI